MEKFDANKIAVVILAAGHGTRMKSDLPKVMHQLGGKPIVEYIVDQLELLEFSPEQIMLVVGYQKEIVQEYFGNRVSYAVQEERNGTAHAAAVGMQALPASVETVLVIGGDDSAFYHADTLRSFISAHGDAGCVLSLLSVEVEDNAQYGRIVRHEDGSITIVEKESVTPDIADVKEVSTGTFCFDKAWFEDVFPTIEKLETLGEYGLPTVFGNAVASGESYQVIPLNDSSEWFGINTTEELAEANRRKVIS